MDSKKSNPCLAPNNTRTLLLRAKNVWKEQLVSKGLKDVIVILINYFVRIDVRLGNSGFLSSSWAVSATRRIKYAYLGFRGWYGTKNFWISRNFFGFLTLPKTSRSLPSVPRYFALKIITPSHISRT